MEKIIAPLDILFSKALNTQFDLNLEWCSWNVFPLNLTKDLDHFSSTRDEASDLTGYETGK